MACRTTPKLTVPTIHLNGSARVTLIEQYVAAATAVKAAKDALRATAPHGRDYYPQGPSALVAAQHEHHERLDRLQEVLNELAALMDAVEEG